MFKSSGGRFWALSVSVFLVAKIIVPETSRPDSDILEFHGGPLPIKRFKDAIHNMIKEAEDIFTGSMAGRGCGLKRFIRIGLSGGLPEY